MLSEKHEHIHKHNDLEGLDELKLMQILQREMQELLEKNLELSRLINVDGLTGLNNRRYFDEFAEIEWKRAIRDASRYRARDRWQPDPAR